MHPDQSPGYMPTGSGQNGGNPQSVPPSALGTSPGYQPILQAKPKGGTRKVFGVLLLLFAVLPLLGTALTAYKTYESATEQNSNDAFIPKAWHNLSSEDIFPARLASKTVGNDANIWARQGIAKGTSCKEAFSADFARTVLADRCKYVLRATYTDVSGEMVATIGLVVAQSTADADAISSRSRRSRATRWAPIGHRRSGRLPFPAPRLPIGARRWLSAALRIKFSCRTHRMP